MSLTKHIKIENKIAIYDKEADGVIVCDNSDYEIEFEFDSEWDAYPYKNVKFTVYRNGRYESVVLGLDGNKCPVPPFSNVTAVEVGVFVENRISTSTAAVIECLKSAHSRASKPAFSVDKIEEWNAALKGEKGDSAYEVAVNNGFVGTEEEWLESLVGGADQAKDYTDNKFARLIPTKGLAYTIYQQGDETYAYCSGMGTATDKDIVIASEYEGVPVTLIGQSAFIDTNIRSVTIPSSVTLIGNSAFGRCKELVEVNLHDGLVTIGNHAFRECDNLDEINIPSTVTSIYPNAFYGCVRLKSIYIPVSVTGIGDYAFGSCRSLSTAYWQRPVDANGSIIEGTVETFGNSIFQACNNLRDFTLPTEIKKVPNAMFGATAISQINLHNGITEIGSMAYRQCNNLEDVVIPEGVTTIGDRAFYNCQGLKTISFPDSVTTLENAVVSGNKLEEIRVPFVGLTKGGQFKSMICGDVSAPVPSLKKVIISSACDTMAANAFEGVSGITICCEAESQPNGWAEGWNNGLPVIWGYKSEVDEIAGIKASIGDISAALDELHTYAESLIGGAS